MGPSRLLLLLLLYAHSTAALEGIGSLCDEDAQCVLRIGQDAVCETGVCACRQGYHYLHGVCWQTRGYGETCSADAECFAFAESDSYACADGVCTCAVDAAQQRPGYSSPLCKRVAREREECESSLDCGGDMTCELVDAEEALDYWCVDSGNWESVVERSSAGNGTGTWRRRRARAEEDSPCGSNEEPSPSDALCVCQKGFFRISLSAPCLPELGEPCWVGEEEPPGSIPYATCRRSAKFPYAASDASAPRGVWACLGGFVADAHNRKCEKTRKVSMNCLVDPQCAYYAGFCEDKKCRCEEGTIYDLQSLLCL